MGVGTRLKKKCIATGHSLSSTKILKKNLKYGLWVYK